MWPRSYSIKFAKVTIHRVTPNHSDILLTERWTLFVRDLNNTLGYFIISHKLSLRCIEISRSITWKPDTLDFAWRNLPMELTSFEYSVTKLALLQLWSDFV
jgi:hypothetical protein